MATQGTLFGHGSIDLTADWSALRRQQLSATAWVDHAPGWLQGHERLRSHLQGAMRWRERERAMYDRIVAIPRLLATLPDDGPGHPVLDAAADALSARYGSRLGSISMAWYRDGKDSVAWHSDRLPGDLSDTLVATVSLGDPRAFHIRPKAATGGGRRELHRWRLGWGDLVVMGGSCQRDFEHRVPKVGHAGPRLVVMFRELEDRTDLERSRPRQVSAAPG